MVTATARIASQVPAGVSPGETFVIGHLGQHFNIVAPTPPTVDGRVTVRLPTHAALQQYYSNQHLLQQQAAQRQAVQQQQLMAFMMAQQQQAMMAHQQQQPPPSQPPQPPQPQPPPQQQQQQLVRMQDPASGRFYVMNEATGEAWWD